ncbi:hypothetical protein Athai_32260 [Actinocatenispora thailandica]|uniref:Uncharacterized protein n=1 Tax=Actinocatenispora thailandica TaxID=227318 RepID=A0A7R7HY51_9ACTN|nr:DUF5829 family protein [Actinocatenispora thailandica]BCJ35723.1 hypothetical protein Athai_32260 [Actinocatenispora thailandica]
MMMSRALPRRIVLLAAVLAVALAGTVVGAAGRAAAAAQHPWPGRQLLFFNHAYGVFDRVTADAIEHSDYLRGFANFQVRTTTGAGGETWTGRYLLGHQTYLELFGTGDVPGKDGELGAAGMGVSSEHAGDLATVTGRLPAEGVPDPVTFQQTRDFGDGVPVPWFDAVYTSEQYDTFGAWAMEYRPEYFADPRSGTEPARFPGDVGRDRYLSNDYRQHLMRDVSGIELAVTRRDLDSTLPLLRAGGFVVRADGTGAVALRGGTTIQFDAVPVAHVGLRRITMSLNHPTGRRDTETIGHSSLAVGPGPRAVWTFATN